MAYTALGFDLFVRDRASGAFHKVGKAMNDTEKRTHSLGRSFAGLAKTMGLALGAAAVFSFAKKSVESLARIQKINAQTAVAIKSTGGAAGVSAKHVENLAARLENLTATEAETVQMGANLLLTFTNIQNKAGAGNAIFDRATNTIVDMSRALGQDMKSSAIQLGKALNDPVKGITALRRVGVSFTKDQEAQIKKLAESGKMLKAQKMILGELNKEFGGSGRAYAKTFAGQWDLVKHKVGEAGETIMSHFMPALSKMVSGLPGVVDKMIAWGESISTKLGPIFQKIGDAFSQLGQQIWPKLQPVLQQVGALLGSWGSSLANILGPALSALGTAFAGVASAILPVIGFFARNKTAATALAVAIGALVVVTKAHAAAMAVAAAGGLAGWIKQLPIVVSLTKVWTAVQWALNLAMRANPIGIVVTAIAALAAGLVYAYKHSETFRNIVNKAFELVKAGAQILWQGIKRLWDIFKKLATFVAGKAAGAFRLLFNVFASVSKGVITAWAWVVDKVIGGVESILNVMSKIPGPVGDAFGRAKASVSAFRDNFNRGVDVIVSKIDQMKARMNSIPKKTRTDAEFKDGEARRKMGAYVSASNSALKRIHDESVRVTVTGVYARGADALGNVGKNKKIVAALRPRRAQGGPVFGPGTETSDSIPVWLSKNEHVWSAEEVRKAGGHQAIQRMRAMVRSGQGGLAKGGTISDPQVTAARFEGHKLPLGGIGQMVAALARSMASHLRAQMKQALAAATPAGHYSVSGGVSRWSSLVRQVMAQLGIPSSYFSLIMHRMSVESGGNPYAINNWDSNAARGDPSRGLMQTIGSTFNAYAGAYRSRGIYDPLANIYAGLNYAIHRYGMGGLPSALGGTAGYDSGGFLMPGATVTLNKSGKPEPVLTNRQWNDVGRLVEAIQKNFGRNSDFSKDARESARELRKFARMANRRLNKAANLSAKAKEFSTSVSEPFLGNDLFGEDATVASLVDTLAAQTAGAQTMMSALRTARRKGLKGELFRLLAASGNTNMARAFAAMAPMQITDIMGMLSRRNAAAKALGDYAGVEYDAQQREMNKKLRNIERLTNRSVKHLGSIDARMERALRATLRQGKSGRRAHGGRVWPGGSFWVGENGPEIFNPDGPGFIHPISLGGGGSVKLEVKVYLDGRELHESLLRVKRKRGGASMGLA